MQVLGFHQFGDDQAEFHPFRRLVGEPARLDRHVFHLRVALLEVIERALGHLLGLGLHHRLRHGDRIGLDQHVHRLLLDPGAQALGDLALEVGLHLIAHLRGVAVPDAERTGEIRIDLRQLRLLDLLDGHGELHEIAGQVLGMVVVGKPDVEALLLARGDAFQGGLEVGQHHAAADEDRVVGRLAAIELRAVLAAGEVDDEAIAFRGGTACRRIGRALLAQHFDGLVDLGVGHGQHRFLDRLAADVGDLELGIDLEDRGEFHLRGVCGLLRLDARLAGDAQVPGAHQFAEGLLDGRADRVGMRLAAVHLRHHLHRHLALAETRHLGGLGDALELLLHLARDLGVRHGHVDAALERIGGRLVVLGRFHEESLFETEKRKLAGKLVRRKGLEPLCLAALEPKSSASTNSATLARPGILAPKYPA